MADPFRITFVCSGNICRSPMAAVVFRRIAEDAGAGHLVTVSSSGTGPWHVGEPADPRTAAALDARGYDGSAHRAAQFDPGTDFAANDAVIALDSGHERFLRRSAGNESDREKISLLLSHDPGTATTDVPDPYFDGQPVFDEVLGMIESACRALFRTLEPAIRSRG